MPTGESIVLCSFLLNHSVHITPLTGAIRWKFGLKITFLFLKTLLLVLYQIKLIFESLVEFLLLIDLGGLEMKL